MVLDWITGDEVNLLINGDLIWTQFNKSTSFRYSYPHQHHKCVSRQKQLRQTQGCGCKNCCNRNKNRKLLLGAHKKFALVFLSYVVVNS